MSKKNLVIVESPAKAKTIVQYLGKDFTVKASMGHIRDLPKSKMGIDIEDDFHPHYGVSKDKLRVVQDLKSALASHPMVWIATDEDREGEAIGWHLVHALKLKKDEVKRIVFHEITEEAIKRAIEEPRKIDQDLVDAQQARRVLDRLVGYELSPLLWKKIRYGLSAGRVQSVAVRLIVDREREILAFKVEEYWDIWGVFHKDADFEAQLIRQGDAKIELKDEISAQKILKAIEDAKYHVSLVEQKEVVKQPPAPFTTSTLQQEAARKLGFSVKKTMIIAQQLYEGVQVHGNHQGLITYMRTDSVHLAESAVKEAQKVIEKEFGDRYALKNTRKFFAKKGAQEAHEAIRPTHFSYHPDSLKGQLDRDQYRLYELIWKRAIACQMASAVLDKMGVDIAASKGDYVFRATGQTVKFDGYMKAYVESGGKKDQEDRILPKLKQGDKVDLKSLEPRQHFTKPPARYTEASLVKKLEAEGIGRPSTYAPTISTIINRGYIVKEKKFLKPTDTAMVVTDVLTEHFPTIVDLKFTAEMEEDLDMIAEGKKKWVPIIREFYSPFHKLIEEKSETIKRSDVVNEKTDEICDLCGSGMVIKLGRFGKFLSCSKYPECKNAKPLPGSESPEKTKLTEELEKKLAGKKCDKCGKPMVIKTGRFGEFLGCSDYPKCKNMQSIIKFTGVKCPQCKAGQLIERRTRKGGRVFYGCNKYPKCKFAVWDMPSKDPCPKCKELMVEKNDGVKCTKCDYKSEKK
ncbi:type I DNA topoisomerase [Candidatus Peregrinibacteria bacterium]|nr:type I DNA topoisomerase [Candidatus Peregrinibacteria bacterium]